MTPLAEIVSTLRTLIADEIGTTAAGQLALGVEPDQRKPAAQGMTVLVCRFAEKGRESGKLTGGTYHADKFQIKMINPVLDDAASTDSAKMAAAREKILNEFNCLRCDYVAPESDRPEQCHIDVFLPRVALKV